MKPFLITTGVVFGLITVAHLWRICAEGSHLAKEPVFLFLTILAGALCYWAFWLLRRLSRIR
jgi:hypothetical protein